MFDLTGCAMFGGTFAASRFEYELEAPVLKRSIKHAHDVIELPAGLRATREDAVHDELAILRRHRPA